MTVFRFVAAASVVLLALLFVADATLAPRGPLFTNNMEGLPRSPQPARPQVAEWPQEPARPRVPALVDTTPEEADAAPAVIAAAPAPPLATVPETSGSASPRSQDRAQSAKAEPITPVTPEPTQVAVAKLDAAATETSTSNPPRSQAAATEAIKPAPKPKMRKHAARKPERRPRYAEPRDEVPSFENGYSYGVPSRKERAEWQRSWNERPWGSEFNDNSQFRF